MAVETSILVAFTDGTSSGDTKAKVELDDKHPNNLETDSEGNMVLKGSFYKDDHPVILISYGSDEEIVGIGCSSGSLAKLDDEITRTRELSNVLFTESGAEIDIPYDDVNSASVKFYGNTCSFVVSKSKITAKSGNFPCIGDFVYPVTFNEQWVVNPIIPTLTEDETYPVAVVIYMRKKL